MTRWLPLAIKSAAAAIRAVAQAALRCECAVRRRRLARRRSRFAASLGIGQISRGGFDYGNGDPRSAARVPGGPPSSLSSFGFRADWRASDLTFRAYRTREVIEEFIAHALRPGDRSGRQTWILRGVK